MITHVSGSQLKVGDVIKVWWNPGRDIIESLSEYDGRYKHEIEWKEAKVAKFAVNGCKMTIFSDDIFERIDRCKC